MGPDFLESALKDLYENQAPLPLKMPQTLKQLLTSAPEDSGFLCARAHRGAVIYQVVLFNFCSG